MTARISSPVFVGRAEELHRLQAVLDGAMAGTVGTVLVGGEAGVGKTRLLAEFRAGAVSAGLRVLEGGCVDLGDGARPYDPFVAALRPWLKSLPAEEFNRIVGPARSAVLQLIPDLESGGEGEAPAAATASATQSDALPPGARIDRAHRRRCSHRHRAGGPSLVGSIDPRPAPLPGTEPHPGPRHVDRDVPHRRVERAPSVPDPARRAGAQRAGGSLRARPVHA